MRKCTDSYEKRLNDRSEYITETGCLIWVGSRDSSGYGSITVPFDGRNRVISTHRLSWIVHCGPIPEGMCVLHRCDIPCCINHHHLFLGTHADNSADREHKRRGNRRFGSQHGHAVLTEDFVRAIRTDPRSNRELANEHGIKIARIWEIRHRGWKHVHG